MQLFEPKVVLTFQFLGPDAERLNKSRFFTRLSKGAERTSDIDLGRTISGLHLNFTIDGEFAEHLVSRPISNAIRRCSVGKDGVIMVDIGVSLIALLLDEKDFRELLMDLLGQSKTRILANLAKKAIVIPNHNLDGCFKMLVDSLVNV